MRKWLTVTVGALMAVVVGAATYVLATALRSEHPVGFQTVTVKDAEGAPLQVGLWYPTRTAPWPTLTGLLVQFVARDAPVDGTKHPLVIISHGIAGSLSSHADTALALAGDGFIVAAPLHTGDNYKDQSAVGSTTWFTDRARHVHLTISYLLEQWRDRGRIDDSKIGVFGFSAGGTTALIAIGGMPALALIKSHCAQSTEFACRVWQSKHATAPDRDAFIHDPRIKAAVVIAPGAGFAFADGGVQDVRVPVQLWGAEKDESVPTPSNAEVVRRELGNRAEWHLVKNAAHFSFMVPCGVAGLIAPKLVCSDPPGFERGAFHKAFNHEVVAFFKRTLTGESMAAP